MFPCKYALSTRSTDELAASRATKALEGDATVLGDNGSTVLLFAARYSSFFQILSGTNTLL